MNHESAKETLLSMREAAVESGIYPYWFIAFGTLLGRCREYLATDGKKNFIDHDDDMDVGIQSWHITANQELAYVLGLKKRGLYKARHRFQRRFDNGRILWTSLRKNHGGCRCCNWFMFNHGGICWHSKGKEWVDKEIIDKRKYKYDSSYQALAKGIPEKLLTDLIEVDFLGTKFNIPFLSGTVLDHWYPGWRIPKKGGASRKDYSLIVPKWEDEKKWRIV